MTPLGASVVFVMISLIFSSLKHMLFPSDEPTTSSNIEFRRIFKLSQLSVEKERPYYKSLYEAYHHSQIQNQQTYTNKLKDRNQFNQSVLSESVRNQQASFVCGDNFMVLVNTVITGSGSQAGWANNVQVYQLPHMRQKDQLVIFGHLQLPKQCKKQKKQDTYELGVVNENRPMLLTINSQGKIMYYSNFLAYLDQYSKEILLFDSTTNYWAYISKEEPWVIHVSEQPFSKDNAYSDSLILRKGKPSQHQGVYNTHNFLEINILDIETYQNGMYEGSHRLNIRHIFIENPGNLYVTCVYEYYNTFNKMKSIIQISFLVKHDQMSLLSKDILDIEEISGALIDTACMIYKKPNTTQNSKGQYELGCVLYKEGSTNVKYTHVSNLYAAKEKRRKKSVNPEDDNGYMEWLQEHFKQLYDGEQGDDLIWMMRKMTPLAQLQLFQKYESSARSKLQVFLFPSLLHVNLLPTQMFILKSSLPNPIILYQCKTEYFLFSCYLEQNDLKNVEKKIDPEEIPQEKKNDYSYFHIKKPESPRFDEQKLRNIKWLDDENLIMICWGGGIQLYRLSRTIQLQTDWTAGVPMSTLLPFIELFATVFCMLQVVWRSPG